MALEDVAEIHEKEELILLGWIHTYTGYSVFLSSMDMHNQYERQCMLMLPEISHFAAESKSLGINIISFKR